MIELYYLSECRKELVDTIELSEFDPVCLPETLLKVYQKFQVNRAVKMKNLFSKL